MTSEDIRRGEHSDPHEQYNPVPRVVLGLVCGMVLWAVGYILIARPDESSALGDQRPASALVGTGGKSTGRVDGAQVYAANCQACHQAGGQGLPGVFPPLAGSPWVTGDPGPLVQLVLHGMTGEIEVLGKTYSGSMPAFGAQLADNELAAVLSYVRSNWGNSAPAVEPDALAAARQLSADQKAQWNGAAELRAFVAGKGGQGDAR
ncbi:MULTISPECIES: c-type cytochrome [Cupriavidus]|uniref:c-type cytochrome n=1 Tax=Cupriavidus sp. DF5525 TaxID=3160989 RepID=UPI0003B083CD|nr:cbb3-type cytochrome C oxidase subunit III [Ralstonia pickettii DTP0602]